MILDKNITKVLILTHYAIRTDKGEDTDQRIRNYLLKNVKKIVHITHPLHDFANKQSYLEVWQEGKLKVTKIVTLPVLPAIIRYPVHLILNYWFLFRYGLVYDLCITMEDLSFVNVFLLRKLGLIKKIVYYSIDFSPQRFSNPLLDKIYHAVDKFAITNADRFWAMTEAMLNGRKMFGITKKNSAPFTAVPIGYETKKIKILPSSKIKFHDLVFMGALRESSGVELTVKAMPFIIKKFPRASLTIVGHGNLEEHLKKLAKKLRMDKHIKFGGYVKNFWDLTKMLSNKSIGLAPYKPDPLSYSNFSDPSRIKLYMVCGLPVIATKITTMTKEIQTTKSGITIDYNEKSLTRAIIKMWKDKKTYVSYKNSAIKHSPKFDINNILQNAFEKI